MGRSWIGTALSRDFRSARIEIQPNDFQLPAMPVGPSQDCAGNIGRARADLKELSRGASQAVTAFIIFKGKVKAKAEKAKKGDSRAVSGFKLQLIKFLLWACERRYSPDDHWTLKDAFEVSTMELRDQFIGAFAQTLKANSKPRSADDEMDDMTAGRMRGRGRRH